MRLKDAITEWVESRITAYSEGTYKQWDEEGVRLRQESTALRREEMAPLEAGIEATGAAIRSGMDHEAMHSGLQQSYQAGGETKSDAERMATAAIEEAHRREFYKTHGEEHQRYANSDMGPQAGPQPTGHWPTYQEAHERYVNSDVGPKAEVPSAHGAPDTPER